MKKNVIAALAVLFIMCSCSTSESALNDLRQLSYDINTQGATYGVSQWKSTAYKYYKVDKKVAKYVAKDKYSQEELEEIGQLQASCATGVAKGVGQNISGKIQSASSLIKGFINGLTN